MGSYRSAEICFLLIFVSVHLVEYSEAFTLAKFREMCQDLAKGDLHSFVNKSLDSFEWVCHSLEGAPGLTYRHLYSDILASSSFVDSNDGGFSQLGYPTKPELIGQNNDTFFIFEFKVNKRAADALSEIEKYRNSYLRQKRDILCVGLNFQYATAKKDVKVDKLKCDWVAQLYSEAGELKKSYEQEELSLDCL